MQLTDLSYVYTKCQFTRGKTCCQTYSGHLPLFYVCCYGGFLLKEEFWITILLIANHYSLISDYIKLN